MHVKDIFEQNRPTLSFEFFPAKTEKGEEALSETLDKLIPLNPGFVSVTYGAGGTTRERTRNLVDKIHNERQVTVVPHLTCVGSTKEQVHELVADYYESGIENILALRGDPPPDQEEFVQPEGGFANATELVAYLREHFPDMGIGVAGYPEGHYETPNRVQEMENLKAKVDAGANYVCTQLCFSNSDIYDFCERCEISGIDVPISVGIMPIISRKGMDKMAELALGSRFPGQLLKALERAETEDEVANVGVHWATEQVRDLIDSGVSGIHLYTLNQSMATLEIYKSLGLMPANADV